MIPTEKANLVLKLVIYFANMSKMNTVHCARAKVAYADGFHIAQTVVCHQHEVPCLIYY